MAHNSYMNDPKFNLIINKANHKERIQARIDAFSRDIMLGDGDVQYVRQVLAICHSYLSDYEDVDVHYSTVKIREAIFWLDSFMEY